MAVAPWLALLRALGISSWARRCREGRVGQTPGHWRDEIGERGQVWDFERRAVISTEVPWGWDAQGNRHVSSHAPQSGLDPWQYHGHPVLPLSCSALILQQKLLQTLYCTSWSQSSPRWAVTSWAPTPGPTFRQCCRAHTHRGIAHTVLSRWSARWQQIPVTFNCKHEGSSLMISSSKTAFKQAFVSCLAMSLWFSNSIISANTIHTARKLKIQKYCKRRRVKYPGCAWHGFIPGSEHLHSAAYILGCLSQAVE